MTAGNKSDVIVLGLGGMGSSACFHLAKRGLSVLGIEQYDLGHALGSSHGQTRIIRKAYFESPDYVPLLNRAYELWRELETTVDRTLYHETGLLYLAPEKSTLYQGILESSRLHGIPIQELSTSEAGRRYPAFNIAEGLTAVLEPEAGYLEVENCIFSHAEAAAQLGARLRFRETVQSWTSSGSSVRVVTDSGTYEAGRLVICAGAWSSLLLEEAKLPLRILRKTLFWYPGGENLGSLPCFLFLMPYGNFYGFPWIAGQGLKIAQHSGGLEIRDPGLLDRNLSDIDYQETRRFMTDVFPGLARERPTGAVCMYTVSPDENFIIDQAPGYPNVVFGAGFSGHGFKFASVIGEILSQLAIDGKTPHPVDFLRMKRFLAS